jgi:ferritin-like metal-binding protein YciE
MEGLIDEGQKIMSENMNPEVMDAAIIACAQKIEHYEICGYGTARAYARQLGLNEAERLLEQTLDEEHQADELLTSMALNSVNLMAETSGGSTGTTYNSL